jgi:hypothetical protein
MNLLLSPRGSETVRGVLFAKGFIGGFEERGRFMCDFLSGVINRRTCEIKFYDGLSHSLLFEKLKLREKDWAEFEWVGEEFCNLTVRTHAGDGGKNSEELATSIVSKYPKRSALVEHFVKTLNKKVTTLYLSSSTFNTGSTVTIPDSVTTLDLRYSTFNTGSTVTIPDSVTTLYLRYSTFNTGSTVTIPDSVTTLYLSSSRGSNNPTIPKTCKVSR